ncbi:MAG: hypothetical protein ABW185_23050 [Sedimenticola sp.]
MDTIEPKDDHKYIVFESALKELLQFCQVCGSRAEVRRRQVRGTMVALEGVCKSNSGHVRHWQSQPSHRGMPVGNLLLAASILFSGSSPAKAINMLKFVNIQSFCLRTFYSIQSSYLLPAIDSIWEDEREAQLHLATGPLSLGGDARCCSPGHTAKYGSYSLMNLQTSKVMDMQLVQVHRLTACMNNHYLVVVVQIISINLSKKLTLTNLQCYQLTKLNKKYASMFVCTRLGFIVTAFRLSVRRQHFQTSSPEPLGQCCPNFTETKLLKWSRSEIKSENNRGFQGRTVHPKGV